LNDLASAEAAPLQVRPARVDLAAALREVELALDGLRRDRNVVMAVTVTPGTFVTCDPVHLERVLRNVVGNALGHSPAGSQVAISVTPSIGGRAVAIRVSDQGSGIAEADVAHVFERFYRADPARSVDPLTGRRAGSGIGLTIARELLAANGGRIEVESTGPDGTTFLLELPGAP
jgi:signal transduction histidine kinase